MHNFTGPKITQTCGPRCVAAGIDINLLQCKSVDKLVQLSAPLIVLMATSFITTQYAYKTYSLYLNSGHDNFRFVECFIDPKTSRLPVQAVTVVNLRFIGKKVVINLESLRSYQID